MRELMRSIARANMRDAGVGHMNRKRLVQTMKGNVVKCSFFSANWRKWVNGNPLKKKSKRRK